jgi:hypothetical protein
VIDPTVLQKAVKLPGMLGNDIGSGRLEYLGKRE